MTDQIVALQVAHPHALTAEELAGEFGVELTGMTGAEASARLAVSGPDLLPEAKRTPLKAVRRRGDAAASAALKCDP